MTPRRLPVAVAICTIVGGAVGLVLVLQGAGPAGPDHAAQTPAAGLSPSEPAVGESPLARLPDDVLLPNMRSRAAFDFRVEGAGRDRVLRFAASLANHGPGPMLVEPLGRRGCPAGQQRVRQVLQQDRNGNGTFERARDRRTLTRRSACMLRHPGHDHWHFDAMASYTLRVADTSRVLSQRRKVSFCLRDNERIRGVETRVRRSWFGDCTARTGQGISPGWVDVYGADLDGQSLRLPPAADGRLLCLDLVADPRHRLLERVEDDNGTSVALRTNGSRVRRAAAVDRCS